ncbi:DUF3857 domain-containing protein [Puteibacter caeruleilacunae]|nr:DUF3857 domain-containing protein [Puteibacter caeruleilacunae]
MKHLILLISLCGFIFHQGIAQNQEYSLEFEEICQHDVNLQIYDKDPEAEAVVMFDKGLTVFLDTDQGFEVQHTRTTRIKILKRSGVKFAEISIPFFVDGYDRTESVGSINAYSYNMVDGELVKTQLKKKTIYTEKINDKWQAKKFAIPNVREGTIIEYQYILESPFVFNLPDWEFQNQIPTMYSEYVARLIPFYDYQYIAQGIKQFSDQHSEKYRNGTRTFNGIEYNDMQHTYVMKDVPAFKDESFITSRNDYIMKLDFQLAGYYKLDGSHTDVITTWPKMIESLQKNQYFGKYMKSCRRVAENILSENLALTKGTTDEKIEALVNYVKTSFSWNGYYSRFSSQRPSELTTTRTGTSGDINLFLIALLKSAGIEALPVLISTRDHGRIYERYPFGHFFNDVIVLAKGEKGMFLTDATQSHLSYNRIPPNCINEKGLVVEKGAVNWVSLQNNPVSKNVKSISLAIDPEQSTIDSYASIQASEFESYNYKVKYRNETEKLQDYLKKHGFKSVNMVKTKNYDTSKKPYIITCRGTSDLESFENQIIVSPFLDFPIKQNKLTQETRNYPIDFIYAKQNHFRSVITIPQNYKPIEIPQNFNLDNELVEIKVNVLQNNLQLIVDASYMFKKAVYAPEEYKALKLHINQIIKYLGQQVVFEKI